MNTPIIKNIEDSKFIELVNDSYNLTELAIKMGFTCKPCGKSAAKLKEKMKKLNVSFKEKEKHVEPKKISKYKNSKQVGYIGEKAFEFYCALNELTFYRDESENEPFDYILNKNGKMYKVQVKTVEYSTKGASIFTIQHGNFYHLKNGGSVSKRKYKSDELDLVFLYSIEYSEAYLLKVDKTKETIPGTLTVRHEKTKNNQTLNIIFSEDILFENIIGTI